MDSISRHEQLLRVFHLIDILFGVSQPLTTAELKRALQKRGVIEEMSDKNIRRDIEFLERFGYSIKRSKKRTAKGTLCQAWIIDVGRGPIELAGPTISLPELLSLAVARDFLAPLAGTFYWRGISQLIAKLEAVATPELLAYVEEHKDGLVVHPKPAASKYRNRTLTAINRAIRNTLELTIRYTSLANDAPKNYCIHPEALVLYDGSIYIAGYRAITLGKRSPKATTDGRLNGNGTGSSKNATEAIRFFKVDRVIDAKPSSRTFKRRQISVETLLEDSITMYRSETLPRRYRIHIAASRARWACEKPFHPRQKVERQPDGSVILSIDRTWDEEMIPQLLGLADCVEVLEPEDARDRILKIAQKIAAKYVCHPVRSFDTLVSSLSTEGDF
ncbi:MAG: WYL domain-containing protein [Planctomycetia bacterium]|nr:WYL domain-containing protein [Planctomycetia bacterium]